MQIIKTYFSFLLLFVNSSPFFTSNFCAFLSLFSGCHCSQGGISCLLNTCMLLQVTAYLIRLCLRVWPYLKSDAWMNWVRCAWYASALSLYCHWSAWFGTFWQLMSDWTFVLRKRTSQTRIPRTDHNFRVISVNFGLAGPIFTPDQNFRDTT